MSLFACTSKDECPTTYSVPAFDQIKLEEFMPAFEAGIQEQKTEVDAIVNNSEEPTFENTVEALDRTGLKARQHLRHLLQRAGG